MHKAELNIMKGMVSVLNESLKRPILSGEQYEMRLADLKQFEEETNFIFTNSPTCKDNVYSVVEVKDIFKNSFERCNDVDSIIKFANKQEMLIHPNIVGARAIIIYNDGIMTDFTLDTAVNLNDVGNIPYKINKKGIYFIIGVLSQNLNFYVTDIVDGGVDKLNLNLDEASNLGFDIVPHWMATDFNPKNFQNGINYMVDYAEEEGMSCDGIVFRFNDTLYSKNGIVYEVLNK